MQGIFATFMFQSFHKLDDSLLDTLRLEGSFNSSVVIAISMRSKNWCSSTLVSSWRRST